MSRNTGLRGAGPLLGSGEFFGRNLSQATHGGLTLMETLYAPLQRVPGHGHEPAYFCALLSGAYWEEYGTRRVSYRPDSVVFHPPGDVHHGDIGPGGGRTFNVAFDDAWLERAQAHGRLPNESADFHGGELSWLARRLHRELAEPDATSELVGEGIALEMLGVLLRWRPPRSEPRPGWLNRAEARLREELHRPVTVQSLALELGVEPVRLSRAFRRHYGETVGERLRRLRVEHVCRRLREGEQPLSELAVEAGFVDQSHLTRVFRKLTGLTPGQYRRDRQE